MAAHKKSRKPMPKTEQHHMETDTHGRKSNGQTAGQYERDPKRRTGQFQGAGDPPLMKK